MGLTHRAPDTHALRRGLHSFAASRLHLVSTLAAEAVVNTRPHLSSTLAAGPVVNAAPTLVNA